MKSKRLIYAETEAPRLAALLGVTSASKNLQITGALLDAYYAGQEEEEHRRLAELQAQLADSRDELYRLLLASIA